MQGLVGKYSLFPVTYEDGLKELEDFISTFGNGDNYLKILREVRNEFREELKSQPVLLKECIESEVNLERKEGAYYKSLLDDRSLKNTSPERVISESPILDKAAVSKRGNNNYKLRNSSKLLFSNPGQALTLFLAAQSAFASAANIQMSNSTGLAIGNDTLSFDNNLSNLSEFEGRINENVSPNSISKSGNFRNSNKVRKEIEVVERDLDGGFTEIRDEFKDLRDTAELVEVLTYVKSQRSKRAANELDSEMETVAEDPWQTIDGLDKRVKELEGEIQKLKNSTSSSDKRDKEQISSLKGQLILLQRSFDDMKRQSNQTLLEKANEIKGLSAMVENLRKQVEDLNKKIQENERRHLPYSCIRDIEDRSFNSVEENLKKMNNTEVKEVIERVYNNNAEGKFYLLLKFSENLRSIPLTLLVYEYLDNEMRKANNSDILKTIDLAKAVLSVKSKVISQQNPLFELMRKANNILNSLKGSIKNMAVRELSDAMKNNTYDKGDRDVFKISNAIFSLNGELFKDFITEVIDNVYGKVSTESVILDFIYQSECTSRRYGYEAILKKMKVQNHLNHGPAVLELARSIKDLTNGIVCGLSLEEKIKALMLKGEFPEYLQVAIFAKQVCIKNVKYNEYLYAAGDYFKYSDESRRVFTWIPQNMVNNGYWILSSDKKGYFSISNTQHDEYLYISHFTFVPPKYHPRSNRAQPRKEVFTWIPKNKDYDADWEFLPDTSRSSVVKMRNIFHNSDLYVSDRKYDDDRRRVLGIDAKDSFDEWKLWKLEDCSNMRRSRDVDEVESYSEPSFYLSDIALEKTKESTSSFVLR
ncbi:coiled-coil domain-containing protein [Wolbachia endosymbiont (group A) of Epistrophe grossularia]|uniref:hypothetical protein n=1 Tax=Wolbachia endosymbiont (group A) of Epistrophe grossularia TaxID=2954008 RepID=UPI002230612F|nr:hypothetical protein [Wolbachia endosymbiont (group A) of Epistrophe grossularia]